jgi:hypothetical protein
MASLFRGQRDRIEQDRSQGGEKPAGGPSSLGTSDALCPPDKSFRLIETCSKLGRDDTV